ncbi:hypothetical protein NKI94_04900 [Mesorhizobium australicum]
MPNQGGSHEQHVKAGQQSHKNMDDKNRRQRQEAGDNQRQQGDDSVQRQQGGDSVGTTRGGTHEQHVRAGEQSQRIASKPVWLRARRERWGRAPE